VLRLLDKLPPHAIEEEAELLSCVMIDDGSCLAEILDAVEPGMFYRPAHTTIFTAAAALHASNEQPNIVRLNRYLVDRGQIEQIGGVEYLERIEGLAPTSMGWIKPARVVKEKATRRKLIETCASHIEAAYTSTEPIEEITDAAERDIYAVSGNEGKVDAVFIGDAMKQAHDDLTAPDGATGLSTGLRDLDTMTGGLHAGELIIVAARPSMGKSIMGLHFAQNAATSSGVAVAFFSIEMSRNLLGQRSLLGNAGVSGNKAFTRKFDMQERAQMKAAYESFEGVPILVDDQSTLSISVLRAKSRRIARLHGLGLIVVDYLQLMNGPVARGGSREQEVSAVSRGLKALARELNVPVVCLSQLNRLAEQRDGHRPRLSDLRESGAIEQDADVVLMLHREDYYNKDKPNYIPTNIAEVIIAKQRNGPTGVVQIHFNGELTKFSNLKR
jgi:replicative DNA helicase